VKGTARTLSEAPCTLVDIETAVMCLRIFHEHVRYPLFGPSPMKERDYHDEAADACMAVVRLHRSMSGLEVVA
jgi:hypothetical protein